MATPTVRTVPATPPTPKFAGEDSRHYTRRKTRFNTAASSSHIADTPPPETEFTPHAISGSSAKSSAIHSSGLPPQSPPSSTHTSPRKRLTRHRRLVTFAAMESKPLDGPEPHSSHAKEHKPHPPQGATEVAASHMLPTPVTQPRKRPISRKDVDSAARVLFPSRTSNIDDAMPHSRKTRRGRKQAGFSLYHESDDEHDGEGVVQIYTDSRDKVPELDHSEENPFLDHQTQDPASSPSLSGRRTRRRKQHVESNPQIEHAFNRDEGMVYIFRGKKVYRQYPPDSSSEREDSPTAKGQDDNTMDDPSTMNLRPLTRSSIKPRLLFPSQHPSNRPSNAVAEVEDTNTADDPNINKADQRTTPEKAPFRPSTPPSTVHAKRSNTQRVKTSHGSPQDQQMPDASTDSVKGPIKKKSPFDNWARTKIASGQSKGKKRDAAEMEEASAEDFKRAKSGLS